MNLDIANELKSLAKRKIALLKLLQMRSEVATLERAVMQGTDVKRVLRIIADEVCAHFKLTTDELMSQSREQSVCLPRQVALYIGRSRGIPFAQIGRVFRRDHGTVLHACRSVRERAEVDAEFSETLRLVQNSCNAKLARPSSA